MDGLIAPFWSPFKKSRISASRSPGAGEARGFFRGGLGAFRLGTGVGLKDGNLETTTQEPAGLAIFMFQIIYESTAILPYIYNYIHIWFSVDWYGFLLLLMSISTLFPPRTPLNERAKALQEKQDWDQFKANEELFGVQSSYNEAAHSVWMDQGFVNVPFWGFWTSLSSICWRLDPLIFGWCSIRTFTYIYQPLWMILGQNDPKLSMKRLVKGGVGQHVWLILAGYFQLYTEEKGSGTHWGRNFSWERKRESAKEPAFACKLFINHHKPR